MYRIRFTYMKTHMCTPYIYIYTLIYISYLYVYISMSIYLYLSIYLNDIIFWSFHWLLGFPVTPQCVDLVHYWGIGKFVVTGRFSFWFAGI